MKQIFYRIIYDSNINWCLRRINKILLPILPKTIKIPPSGIIKINNVSGQVLKIKTNQTNYLTKFIFWEKGYEKFEYTKIFIKLIKKLLTFYDIGANIGYYSLIAAMENKNIKVIGFEPASGPLYFFKENVSLNRYNNIKIESIALSNVEGVIDFFEIKNRKYKYIKYNLSGIGNTKGETDDNEYIIKKVKSSTLDNYVKINKERNIDLIKLDTEGTEHLILQKAHTILNKMKPIIICETLFNSNESELEQIMKSYGYEFYNHTDKGLVKTNSIIRKEDNGVRNCFFVHPDKSFLIEEFVVNDN